MLYLGSLKDEGVLFYYARPARRLSEVSGNSLPAEANYLVLTGEEWEHWSERSSAQVIDSLHDEQGAPIVLVHRLPPRIQ